MIKKQLIIIISFVFYINAFGQSNQITNKEKVKLYPSKDIVSRYHNNWTQVHYKERITDFINEPLENNDIIFIGNSITEKGENWSEKYSVAHIKNRGIAGDVTDGVLKRLDEIIYYKPKAVFILIGINDLFNIHHEEAGGNFIYDKIVPSTDYVGENILKITKILHHKTPNTKIFVRTILPSRIDYLKEDILSVNKIITKNEVKGYYKVIDWYNKFVDSNGYLIKDLTVDGVHLTDKGYSKWVEIEKNIIEQL